MHFVVVKPMGHGSCIMGHERVFVWVSGSLVTVCDPMTHRLLCLQYRPLPLLYPFPSVQLGVAISSSSRVHAGGPPTANGFL